MTSLHPEEHYNLDLEKLNKTLQYLQSKKRYFAWLRLSSFLAAIIGLWLLFSYSLLLAAVVFIIFITIFIFFVSTDTSNSNKIDNTVLLIDINKNELAALHHQYLHFPDGTAWKPDLHDYANDLDIFGRASLYQYCNRTTSQQGNKLFSGWLLQPATVTAIKQRQAAVKELTEQVQWRQQLQAFGISIHLTIKTEENIQHWLNEENSFINKKSWQMVRVVFPLLSLAVLGLYLADVIDLNRFLPLMLLFLIISNWISGFVEPAYIQLNKITGELETLSASIQWIEKKSFTNSYLQQLKNDFDIKDAKASGSIKKLKKILDRLDYRLNPVVYIPLSAFLCWDLQQIFALEKWKSNQKKLTGKWFSSLAAFEAISSIANLSFNHPDWTVPVISENESLLQTEDMGHPLIPAEKRITSSFATAGESQINLITGSNMAGKSTFLRSTGVNIVLAMMGAPVCASSFSLSPVKVMSSMRISDNLEESTSTFYAELKKLKEIIEAVYRNEKVFLLLDEILRGTNSADRHTGSTALLKQLIQHKAVGMLATHDLELAKLVEIYPSNIHNYHFDVQVANDELFFDYKLKRGVCRSMNASILMKKIGIEL